MLKTRVIPLLLIKNGLLTKPLRFVERHRTVSNALSQARVFESRQVDELILLDIGASSGNGGNSAKSINSHVVQQIALELTVPLTVGGGVRDVETIHRLVFAGAEKVTLNTGAIQSPDLISAAAERFGSQCVVLSIDVKRHSDGALEVFSNNGKFATGLDPCHWAVEAVKRGAGELLVNSIDYDGVMEGFDIDLMRAITDVVDVPVIAAGGGGVPSHFVEVVKKARVAAVCAGSMFFFRRTTPLMVKDALRKDGVDVRIESCVDLGTSMPKSVLRF